ncbi:response regulator [Krasilnikovia sp. MM14-A1004]|uniref:response regulator n=1 Tax=Krasilnikovia sp. MM14-A1004 TaxID=3373541 RepID=UPI00399C6029
MQMLVVDDDLDVQDMMAACLRTNGHTVLVADDAADALAEVERHGMPDAVVLNVAMPGTDGITLLHQLRQRVPNLPALFITGFWNSADHIRVSSGSVGCLSKPFTCADMFQAVRELSATAS